MLFQKHRTLLISQNEVRGAFFMLDRELRKPTILDKRASGALRVFAICAVRGADPEATLYSTRMRLTVWRFATKRPVPDRDIKQFLRDLGYTNPLEYHIRADSSCMQLQTPGSVLREENYG
jgi:hypothetical protein